ncbi:MAG: Ig-like domain-containing protein [Bermanella sp.]
MPLNKLVIFTLSLAFSQLSFSAACPASSDTTTAGNGTCDITGSASTITLNFTSGFDSSTSATAVDGNNGTTVGAQRKLSFIKAAEVISEQVTSTVTIIVEANFTALSCTTNSATLGSAGATANLSISSSPPTGILVNTFYPIGLYNAITGSDASGAHDDIDANFNSDIGDADCLASSSWYYGFSDATGSEIGFTTVLLHEMTHGLGFASLVDPSDGSKTSGIDDIFSNNLYDNTNSRNWNDGSESDANRASSATSVTALLWSGTNVNTNAIGLLTDGFNDVDTDGNFESGDKVEMYAPASVESGSSVSHFTTDATPNELMEPSYTDSLYSLGLALYLLEDIGWTIVEPNNAPTITAVDQTTNEDTAKVVDASGWGSDADSDSLTYTVSTCPANITCSIDSDGQNLTLTPDDDYNGATNTVTIQVDDGNDGITTDDLNLTVSAQNDAPVWSTISEQNTNEDTDLVIDLSGYGTDVDGDSLTYSVTSCATNITCSVSGNDLTLSPTGNYSGATHNITVEVDDSTASAVSTSFNLVVNAQNDAPVWSTISEQNTNEDNDLVIDLSDSASDVDGDSLTYSVTSCATNITCSVSGSNLTLSPDSNHNGATHNITVEVDDSIASAVSTSFNLVVNAQNDAPTITAVDQTTSEDNAIVVDISSWGSDGDGDSVTYSITTCASNITCSISGTDLTLTPDGNHNGATHSITIEVDDGNSGTASDSFNLNVSAQNDAPAWSTISAQNTNEDTDLVIDLSGYASDTEGDSLTYSVTSCASNITCAISGNNLTLTPDSNHNGATHNITVAADDSTASAVSTSFNLVVNAQNDAPSWSAIPDQNIDDGDNSVISLGSYASDTEGDSLTYSATSCGANLTCSISGSSLTVSASGGAGTTVSVTIEADDGNSGTSSDSFDVNITNPANNAPTITAVDQSTSEDNAIVVDISDWGSDADSDSLTYSVTSCASNITCSISGTNLTLTPDSNHNGATHSITIEVDDGNSGTASDSFNLNVSAQNDAPVLSTISAQNTNEDTSLVIDLSGYASDTEGDSLTYSVTSCVSNIICSISGSNLTLTPDSNHNGATHNVTVQIDDGNSGTDSTSFNLVVNAQNDAPAWSAIPDQSIDDGDNTVISLGSYASDIEGDSLTYTATSCGANLTCNISGSSLTVSASGGAGTTVSVTIEADDGNSGTSSDSFDISITNPANNAPTITAVDQTTSEDNAIVVDISGWASDSDGDSLTYSVTTCASNITCSISGTDLTLTPDNNHNGATHSITVEVDDGNSGTTSDSFNLNVSALNDAPAWSAIPDQTITDGESASVSLDTYASDTEGDSLSYTITSCGTNLTCSITGSSLTVSASGGSGSTITVTIEADDGNSGTSSDSFSVTINAANNTAPTLSAQDQSTDEDTSTVVDISSWGSDADGDTLTYSVSTCASNITCSLSGTSLTLTPDGDHSGTTHSITLQASDGNGGTVSDSFNLEVVAVNDIPILSAVDQSTSEDSALVVDISAWGSDVDGDTLTYSVSACASQITCELAGNDLTLTPDADHTGTSHNITLQVSDGNGGVITDSFNLEVTLQNDSPVLAVVDQTTSEDMPLVVDISSWGTDADDDALTFSISSCATHITCELTGTSLTLTPENNHNGASHDITVQVSDANGGSATDIFNLNIVAINDAPVFSAPADVDLIIGDNYILDIVSLASDIEEDALIFSVLSCGNNLACSINSGNLHLLASGGAGSSVQVSVQALDENGGSASYNFNVNISAYSPSTYIEVAGSSYQHEDSLAISLQEVQVDVLGGSGDYQYALEFIGVDASDLMTINDTGLTIALPETGAFTGDYSLIITDNNNQEVITFTLIRPLRLVWSSTSILSGDTGHTLTIEGGEAGSQYNISQLQESVLIFEDENNEPQTVFTAADSAESFNGISASIKNDVVLTLTSVEVSVETLNANYPDIVEFIQVYPAVEHSISVIDESGLAIPAALGLLAENALLAELNLELEYIADDQGQITIRLPDNDELYGFSLSADEFNPATISLEAGINEYEVILEAMGNSIILSGSISALGTQDFLRNPPAVRFRLDDGNSILVTVTVSNSSQASFSQDVDLNQQILQTMSIEQADSLNIEVDISDLTQNQTFNVLLERSIAVVVSSPTQSGGGSMGIFYFLGLILLLGRRLTSRVSPHRTVH